MKIKYKIGKRKTFEVGDFVVVLPEDKFYKQLGETVVRVVKIKEYGLPYKIKGINNSYFNVYTHIRHAEMHEIENATKK